MSDEIADVKESLMGIGNLLAMRKPKPDIRFGAVFYRDISDKDMVEKVPLSRNLDSVRQSILDVVAEGGGDWEEHVGLGLHKALEMDWSHSSDGGVRLIYLVGDAPPQHYADGYDVDSALALAQKMGVKVHVIGCSGLRSGTAAMRRIAEATGGNFSTFERLAGGQQRSAGHSRAARAVGAGHWGHSRAPRAPGAGHAIGIDLGTEQSRVAVMRDGRVEVVPNAEGERMTPSYVAFTDTDRLVGEAARQRLVTDPARTLYGVKRLIGRPFDDPRLHKEAGRLAFNVTQRGGSVVVSMPRGDKECPVTVTLEDVLASLVIEAKTAAERYLGEEVKHAVLTVPAHFDDAQRKSARDAAVLSGLNVLRLVNEPTAAAIAHGLDRNTGTSKNILVYHLGGGSLDVSLLAVEDDAFEILATGGDLHLGGADLDQRVVDYWAKAFERENGKSLAAHPRALQKLRREAQRAKEALSSSLHTRIEVEDLHNGTSFSAHLSRSLFEALNDDLLRGTLKHVAEVLEDAGLRRKQVDDILLVGGSSKIPRVQQLLRGFFSGKELHHEAVNPEEAAVFGAAIQAAVLSGEGGAGSSDLLLLDVTPLTLGIEGSNGSMVPVVRRNTVIPTRASRKFSTSEDNQTTFAVLIFEGERPVARENRLLANLSLTGIPAAPAGVPQLEVTLELDAEGLLHIVAEEKGSGKSTKILVDNSGRPTEEEIERMLREAEAEGFVAGAREDEAAGLPEEEEEEAEEVAEDEPSSLGRLSAMMFASIQSEL